LSLPLSVQQILLCAHQLVWERVVDCAKIIRSAGYGFRAPPELATAAQQPN
jgi:hypothetical protein